MKEKRQRGPISRDIRGRQNFNALTRGYAAILTDLIGFAVWPTSDRIELPGRLGSCQGVSMSSMLWTISTALSGLPRSARAVVRQGTGSGPRRLCPQPDRSHPRLHPVLGYLDDLVVIPLGVLVVRRWIPDAVLEDCRARAERLTTQPISRVGAAIVVGVWLLSAGLTVWLIRGYLAA
jgi:hypothetical protein